MQYSETLSSPTNYPALSSHLQATALFCRHLSSSSSAHHVFISYNLQTVISSARYSPPLSSTTSSSSSSAAAVYIRQPPNDMTSASTPAAAIFGSTFDDQLFQARAAQAAALAQHVDVDVKNVHLNAAAANGVFSNYLMSSAVASAATAVVSSSAAAAAAAAAAATTGSSSSSSAAAAAAQSASHHPYDFGASSDTSLEQHLQQVAAAGTHDSMAQLQQFHMMAIQQYGAPCFPHYAMTAPFVTATTAVTPSSTSTSSGVPVAAPAPVLPRYPLAPVVAAETDPRELERFAEHFKQRRIKLGVTQADVGKALAHLKMPGVGSLSQSTICRFESLTLSHNNMVALKPILHSWLEKAEEAMKTKDALGGATTAEIAGILPSSDKKRKRTSIAAPEKRVLEEFFKQQPRPSGERIAQIADKLDLKKNVVRVWFCNQRQKQKRDYRSQFRCRNQSGGPTPSPLLGGGGGGGGIVGGPHGGGMTTIGGGGGGTGGPLPSTATTAAVAAVISAVANPAAVAAAVKSAPFLGSATSYFDTYKQSP